jgi:hypothetical protein
MPDRPAWGWTIVLEKGRGIGMAFLSFIFIIGFGDAQY